MNIEAAAGLFAVLLVLALVPGPSDFLVATRAITLGFRQAVLTIAGILFADLLLIAVAVFSLGGLADALEARAELLSLPAGLLLIGFGVSTLRSTNAQDRPTSHRQHASGLLSGFLVTLADPKALVFYFGLFPAFLDLDDIRLRDVSAIFLIVTLLICGVKGTYAWLACNGVRLLPREGLRSTFVAASGLILIGTGAYLLIK